MAKVREKTVAHRDYACNYKVGKRCGAGEECVEYTLAYPS